MASVGSHLSMARDQSPQPGTPSPESSSTSTNSGSGSGKSKRLNKKFKNKHKIIYYEIMCFLCFNAKSKLFLNN